MLASRHNSAIQDYYQTLLAAGKPKKEGSVTGSNHNGVYKETVQLGDSEIEIEYGDVVWGDIELPPMALEISGANYHAQLDAVRKFLSWQDRAEAFQREEMQRNEQLFKAANGKLREYLNEDRIELWHSSVYEDATRSIAAAVMLTPLIESLFHRLALELGAPWQGRRIPREIMKLVTYCGLSQVATDLGPMLRALFAYRNNMFHWGVEWPIEVRGRFDRAIWDSGWPRSWFDQAIDGDGSWVFYLTEEFVSRCLDLFEELFDAVRAYIQTKGLDFGRERSDQLRHQGKPLNLSPLRAVLAEASQASTGPAGVDAHLP